MACALVPPRTSSHLNSHLSVQPLACHRCYWAVSTSAHEWGASERRRGRGRSDIDPLPWESTSPRGARLSTSQGVETSPHGLVSVRQPISARPVSSTYVFVRKKKSTDTHTHTHTHTHSFTHSLTQRQSASSLPVSETAQHPLDDEAVTNEHTAKMSMARIAALEYYQKGRCAGFPVRKGGCAPANALLPQATAPSLPEAVVQLLGGRAAAFGSPHLLLLFLPSPYARACCCCARTGMSWRSASSARQ